MDPVEAEDYIRRHLVRIAEAQFPDNPGLEWAVLGFRHREDLGVLLAEVEPRPDEVGYPRFQFAFLVASDPPTHVATYCFESGRYALLSTGRGAPRGLPPEVE